MCDMDYNIL